MAVLQESLIGTKPLQGQVALVTGASRGIGADIAKELAVQGATVVINYLSNQERARMIVEEIATFDVDVLAIQADVGTIEGVHHLSEKVLGVFGKVDILVNNAGITRDGRFLNITQEHWEDVLRTNLTSIFHLSQSVLPSMVELGNGKIQYYS